MQVGRGDDCCDVHRGDRVHVLYGGEDVHGVLHEGNGVADDGEAQETGAARFLEECGGWTSEKVHRHEAEGEQLPRAPEVEEEEENDGHEAHDVHGVHGVRDEGGLVFYRDEPMDPRIPDPRKD